MTFWLLIVDIGSGPEPFALFFEEWACDMVLRGLTGAVADCKPVVRGVAL
jgi:hypothetical protein